MSRCHVRGFHELPDSGERALRRRRSRRCLRTPVRLHAETDIAARAAYDIPQRCCGLRVLSAVLRADFPGSAGTPGAAPAQRLLGSQPRCAAAVAAAARTRRGAVAPFRFHGGENAVPRLAAGTAAPVSARTLSRMSCIWESSGTGPLRPDSGGSGRSGGAGSFTPLVQQASVGVLSRVVDVRAGRPRPRISLPRRARIPGIPQRQRTQRTQRTLLLCSRRAAGRTHPGPGRGMPRAAAIWVAQNRPSAAECRRAAAAAARPDARRSQARRVRGAQKAASNSTAPSMPLW